jgi:hypothetical protein
MALIPVRVGDRTALVEKQEKPCCSVPQCKGDHWTNCDYPILRGGKWTTCDVKLCEEHVITHTLSSGSRVGICPAHARFSERAQVSKSSTTTGKDRT